MPKIKMPKTEWIEATFPPKPNHPNLEQETIIFAYDKEGFYCNQLELRRYPMSWEAWQELRTLLIPFLRANATSIKMRLVRDDLLGSD